MEKIDKQPCVFCSKKTLTLMQDAIDIPFFGKVFVFSMDCSNCNFNKSDVEAEQIKEPSKISLKVNKEKDLAIRVIKSSNASIKIPELKLSVRPGPAAEGYVSNIEGVLTRFKKIVESARDGAEEDKDKKAAKNLLKKMWKAQCGELPFTVIIEDPTGNSGIVSKEAKIEKLKQKK